MSAASDRRVFVDTSAYFAVTNRRDADHLAASATLSRLHAERRRLITTKAVMFELHGLLINRISRQIALDAVATLRASQTIVRVRASDEARAETILIQYDDRSFSYVDALSFAVMERLSMQRAFSLDRHFTQFGCISVPLEAPDRGSR